MRKTHRTDAQVLLKRTGWISYCGVRKAHQIDAQVDLVIGAGVKNAQAEPAKGARVKRTG